MSKEKPPVAQKSVVEPYEKFLFFLVQHNPFLAVYFRRHKPSDGFIYTILNAPKTEQGTNQVKTLLFNQIRTETTDLDKICFLTKMVFGKHRIPGLVEDFLSEDWAEKKYDLEEFLMIKYTNQVTAKNVEKVFKSIDSSFDRWFFCKVYIPHAQRLQMAEHVKFIETLPDQETWKTIGAEVKELVYLPMISSPYQKEHVSRAWPENIVD